MTKQLRLAGAPSPNSFGHDRLNPALELVRSIPDNMPPAIYLLMEACDRIFLRPQDFKELQFPELSRRRRSERREAIVRVAKAEGLRMDLVSSRVGQLHGDREHIKGIPVTQIAAWTGLEHGRVERAFADLMRAGYQNGKRDRRGRLCAAQPKECEVDPATGETRYKGLPAVRRFTPLFFRKLGVELKIEAAQKAAAKKRRVAREAAELERAAAAQAAIADVARRARIKDAPDPRPPPVPAGPLAAAAADEAANNARRLAELGLAIGQRHPDWPPESVRAEARRLLLGGTGPPE